MEKKNLSLKGIILVGGHSSGTRFRPLSMDTPKPLFPIAGKPMIYHHVAALSKVPGMKEVLIIGFYEASVFDRFLTETQIEFPRLSIRYLREYKCLGTAGGVHHFRDEIRRGGISDFFVMNADIASSFPLLGLYMAHSKNDAVCTMLSAKVDQEEANKYGCIVCDPKDEEKVLHFVEKPETFISNVISCGVYIFSANIFSYLADALSNKRDKEIEEGTPMTTVMHSNLANDDLIQLEKDVLPLLMPKQLLFTWTCVQGRDFWMQVKTGSATISANRAYLQHFIQSSPRKLSLSNPKTEEEDVEEQPKATIIDPVVIHPSAMIHPTAKIGPNVSIGPRCVIGRGVRIRDSIILDNCEINHDSCILNSVLGWDSKIGSWVRIEGAPFTDPLALTSKGFKLPSAKLINLVASSSLISKSYYLDQLNHPISQQSRQYLRHKPQLTRRSPSLFLHQETESFSIYLSCEEAGSDCQFVLDHLARASKRVENVLLIRNRIRINATYDRFCKNGFSSCNPLGTLGFAAPTSLHQFLPDRSLPRGIDYDYVYPSALVRQLLPSSDPALNNADPDLSASFNSNVNWWFSYDVGKSNTPGFGPASTNSSLKSYDFEQVAVHEILHGLGFVSGWSKWLDDGGFYPSFQEYNDFGQFAGLGPSWIFDKHMSDAINGIWIRDYDAAIRKDILESIDAYSSNWKTMFSNTTGSKIAQALTDKGSPFTTPRGLWSWFPVIENTQITSRYAILYTPTTYAGGSSISHMDDKYYSGTSQYIMRPGATKNVGLDGYVPYNKLGPISESVLGILRAMGYSTVL